MYLSSSGRSAKGRSSKSVRFNEAQHRPNKATPSERSGRPGPSTTYTEYVPQPGPTKRHSLPTRIRSRDRCLRALEALNGMRAYIKEACNFHGEHLRRALSVPSVSTLSALISYTNKLRKIDSRITQRDETTVAMLIDPSRRHPHELLLSDDVDVEFASTHERSARLAHKKRMCRESEHYLMVFVSRQLRVTAASLRQLSLRERSQCELDALKERIAMFNGTTGHTLEPGASSGRIHSLPNSPANRMPTATRSPQSVPAGGIWHEYSHDSGLLMHGTTNMMGDLRLPKSSYDINSRPTRPTAATLRQATAKPYMSSPAVGFPVTSATDVNVVNTGKQFAPFATRMTQQPSVPAYMTSNVGSTSTAYKGMSGVAQGVPGTMYTSQGGMNPVGGYGNTGKVNVRPFSAPESMAAMHTPAYQGNAQAAGIAPSTSPYVGPTTYGAAAATVSSAGGTYATSPGGPMAGASQNNAVPNYPQPGSYPGKAPPPPPHPSSSGGPHGVRYGYRQ